MVQHLCTKTANILLGDQFPSPVFPEPFIQKLGICRCSLRSGSDSGLVRQRLLGSLSLGTRDCEVAIGSYRLGSFAWKLISGTWELSIEIFCLAQYTSREICRLLPFVLGAFVACENQLTDTKGELWAESFDVDLQGM